jgi:hypothetical protein
LRASCVNPCRTSKPESLGQKKKAKKTPRQKDHAVVPKAKSQTQFNTGKSKIKKREKAVQVLINTGASP